MNQIRNIERKINNLPLFLMNDIELYIDFLSQKYSKIKVGKFKQSWAGALKEYSKEYTSIELQKKSLEWRIN